MDGSGPGLCSAGDLVQRPFVRASFVRGSAKVGGRAILGGFPPSLSRAARSSPSVVRIDGVAAAARESRLRVGRCKLLFVCCNFPLCSDSSFNRRRSDFQIVPIVVGASGGGGETARVELCSTHTHAHSVSLSSALPYRQRRRRRRWRRCRRRVAAISTTMRWVSEARRAHCDYGCATRAD